MIIYLAGKITGNPEYRIQFTAAKMELERSRQTQSWNSERQMAKASNAYDANIMMEAELVKNITKGENNGNFK